MLANQKRESLVIDGKTLKKQKNKLAKMRDVLYMNLSTCISEKALASTNDRTTKFAYSLSNETKESTKKRLPTKKE